MHWLLILAILSSTTNLKNGGSPSQMNQLASNALRQQLGGANNVGVQITPGRGGGDFDAISVNLDGFSADNLMNLANRAGNSTNSNQFSRVQPKNQPNRKLQGNNFDIEDIFGQGGLSTGDLGSVLGGIFGSKQGRIGRLKLNAANFSFQGARYDFLSADLGEIRFDWGQALQGNFDIQSVAPGNLMLQLRGDQAAKLLAPRLPSLQNVQVRFDNGRAFVGANAGYYGVNVPFEVGARLSVQQNRVMADNFQASVARLQLPNFVLNELTRGVNPLYDFDPQNRWPLAVNLQTAGTNQNALQMRGGIQWRGFSNQKSNPNTNPPRRKQNRTNGETPGQDDILGQILGGVLGR